MGRVWGGGEFIGEKATCLEPLKMYYSSNILEFRGLFSWWGEKILVQICISPIWCCLILCVQRVRGWRGLQNFYSYPIK